MKLQICHYDLARALKAIGLIVTMDEENNERSEIWLSKKSKSPFAEILGDHDCTIKKL